MMCVTASSILFRKQIYRTMSRLLVFDVMSNHFPLVCRPFVFVLRRT